ncbi:MAG: PAS domain-containing protein [Pseudomonadota bacterium]
MRGADKNRTLGRLMDVNCRIDESEPGSARRGTIDRDIWKAHEYAESIVDTIREPLVILDGGLKVLLANRPFYQVFEVTPEETQGQFIYDLGNHQWSIPKLRELLDEILPQHTEFRDFKVEHYFESIGKRVMILNARRVIRDYDKSPLILLAIEDVTDRHRAEEERDRLIKELQDALATVKTLSGLLPICASCKKIRDDAGYWTQIETYIRNHSEAEFSHSICPDCAEKVYQEIRQLKERDAPDTTGQGRT